MPPALAISVLGSYVHIHAGMYVRTTTYALCVFTHTACPASCSSHRGDAEAMHRATPRHLASRIHSCV